MADPGVWLRTITAFHLDDEGQWVADLACGHTQHVRHDPPWQRRPWVVSATGRAGMLGAQLECGWCERREPPDPDGAMDGA